ncbi:hypothetical protein BJY52DRAFT_1184129 [Lactarius psammicola]|nr:hypothetical protein BJY52DRAFT_1184129 [Lactarius psammicola]
MSTLLQHLCAEDALQALKLLIVVNLDDDVTAGTRYSTHAVAGIISSINDSLLANGKVPRGFPNP